MRIFFKGLLLFVFLCFGFNSYSQVHVDDGNNVGVKTATPTSELDVDGKLRIRDIPVSTDNNILVTDQDGNVRQRDISSIVAPIEGNSSSVTAGSWYRIAVNNGGGKRANAEFILQDRSGGGHSTLTFKVGISYGNAENMAFTLLNHSYYSVPTFSKIRVLEKSTL